MVARRDYSLTGDESLRAKERGLASARWYASPIPRKRMKALMQRRDGPAIRDVLLWFGLIIGTGTAAAFTWGSWWGVPVFIVYGALYAGPADSRWHECGHGTAFKTRWMNDVVYQIASFLVLREPTVWRWSHTRHHTDTIIVGRDPEIAAPKPPDLLGIALNLLYLKAGLKTLRTMLLHAATGRLTAEEKDFIPESEWPKVIRTARIWTAIFAGVIALSIATGSLLPLMLVGLPSFYGGWAHLFFGLTQHAGLAEDVLDHRLNSRTIYMNPIFRFLYLNMNYHIEHHMFPMVPYHALRALHEEMKDDCPPAYPSTWAAYREILAALWRQAKDPAWAVERRLPPGAGTLDGHPAAAE